MKCLTIFIILMLSVYFTAIAQQLERFKGEKLEYSISASLFGFIPTPAGRAFIRCLPTKEEGFLLSFHGYGSAFGKKADDSAAVLVDQKELVKEITHSLPGSGQERWLMDYFNKLIYHFKNDTLLDILKMDHLPMDALFGIYTMRTTTDSLIKVGYERELNIIGHIPNSLISSWKPARFKVVREEVIKVQNCQINCWRVVITLDAQDNLFRSKKVTIWLTKDEKLIPVKVKTGIKFLFFPVITVKGELITPIF